MIEYNVYVGIGGPTAQQTVDYCTELGGYALGLDLPGFTAFTADGGWEPVGGEPVYEPVVVFRFILDLPARQCTVPSAIRAFAEHAKHLFKQRAVLITQAEVDSWLI